MSVSLPEAGVPLEPKPRGGKRRLRIGILLVALLAFGLLLAWFVWLVPQPPEVNTTDAGPGVAEDVAEARLAVRLKPFSAEEWGNLGLVLQLYLYYPEAAGCYARAAELDPRSPRWPYLHALIQLRGDLESGLPLLERSVALGGQLQTPRLVLGETLVLRGRLDEAEKQFRGVLQVNPSDPRALLGLGRVALARGDLAGALGHLDQSAQAAPRVRMTHALLAQVAFQNGDKARADRERAVAAELPERTAWPDPHRVGRMTQLRGEAAAVFRATSLREQGQTEQAIELLRLTLKQHPDSAMVHRALGRAHFQSGEWAAADKAFGESVRLGPGSLESRFEWGVALQQQEKFQAAAEQFRQAIALRPEYGEAHYHLGQCLERLADESGAITAYREAVRFQPDRAGAYQDLGALLAIRHEDAEAESVLQLALRLDPSHQQTQRWLEVIRQRNRAAARSTPKS